MNTNMLGGNYTAPISQDISYIQGQPVLVNYVVDELSFVTGRIRSDDEIKMLLCHQVVNELYNKKLIEFTRENSYTGNIHYRARLFAVPNTEIQILRVKKIIL